MTRKDYKGALERRPGQIQERHDLAEDSTRQGKLEAAAFAQPRGTKKK